MIECQVSQYWVAGLRLFLNYGLSQPVQRMLITLWYVRQAFRLKNRLRTSSEGLGPCCVWLDMCPPLKRAGQRGVSQSGEASCQGLQYENTAGQLNRSTSRLFNFAGWRWR